MNDNVIAFLIFYGITVFGAMSFSWSSRPGNVMREVENLKKELDSTKNQLAEGNTKLVALDATVKRHGEKLTKDNLQQISDTRSRR